ncbi:phage holin family protein [Pectobacterium brasiliense]|uniref:phage holin family protein n=1 Tax=Pectobacterium TaxID=122277 RepID=UPI0015E00C18|nr:phage holin family protein [Pectobacterium brasiliense]MBA0208158.1 phage holin family protein [Pectobacterium brasiliense]MCA5919786.1 phage holin family protein [Pectobacterium brasiliense]MCA5926825.1 phage holin family protein [Pectobacterium brasiliense]MCA5935211.1 phage holin family protein [Pectobacterium brasiliense]MCA5938768.1 phage holin family protein [Pectobacterium brasiliense]
MTDKSQQGPASGVMASAQRIISIIVSMVESRVRLAVIELEEEKANLIQLLIMVGLTLLFAAFGIMSLIALIIWGIDPQYRLFALGGITATLLGLALIGGIWTLVKVRRSTLLKATRKELATDRSLLEDDPK